MDGIRGVRVTFWLDRQCGIAASLWRHLPDRPLVFLYDPMCQSVFDEMNLTFRDGLQTRQSRVCFVCIKWVVRWCALL